MKYALGDLYSEEAVRNGDRHLHGGHDLRVAAVPDHAQLPEAGLRQGPRGRRRLLPAPRGGGLRPRLRRRRLRPVHEVPAPRLGLLHRRGRRRARGRRQGQARQGPGHRADRERGRARRRHPSRGRPRRLRHRLRLDEPAWPPTSSARTMADKVGKVWGLGSDTTKDPGPVGGRAAQHVEADPAGQRCGSTAATCTSRASTRSTSRCSSRPAPSASRPRCTGARSRTTRREVPSAREQFRVLQHSELLTCAERTSGAGGLGGRVEDDVAAGGQPVGEHDLLRGRGTTRGAGDEQVVAGPSRAACSRRRRR